VSNYQKIGLTFVYDRDFYAANLDSDYFRRAMEAVFRAAEELRAL
jgi:hypothetical protein